MFSELAASIPDILSIFNGQAAKRFPTQKAYRIEEIASVRRKNAKRIRITYGPYALRAANVCQTAAHVGLTKLTTT
jgi:hypothetical protein